VKVYCKGATGCSWNGVSYEADADGACDVPPEAAADLASHGFTTEVPAAPEATEAVLTGNPAKWTNDVLAAEAVRLGLDATLARPALIKAVAEGRKAEADAACAEAETE
jgi:hypothetical protein